MYYIYFAKSIRNGKIYVGRTGKEPKERIREHNTGSNAWSKQNGPFNLVYFEMYNCLKDSILREAFYKSGIGKRIKYAIVKEMDM